MYEKNKNLLRGQPRFPRFKKENIVQYMIKSRTATRVKSYDWLLKGLVCCKECGKKLSLVPQNILTKQHFI